MSMSLAPRRRLMAGTGLLALTLAAAATPAHAVIPNETKTPADIVDNADTYRGVGVIVTNVVGQGGVGICTATLINPRTVLFAAHCVNTRPETAYDGTTVRAAVSFNVNSLPGVQNWFTNNRTNTALSVFNVNSIVWDARSVQNPAALGFIEADIALASLDTPAAGIPTWALLFSTLPAPATIDPALGTGYHVNIVGYGNTGSALTGPTGVDWRRRAAENMLGGFMSLSDRNAVLFGAPSTLTQNLYQIDFDSQNRQAVFDINVHRDNALPNEGTTAPGDSGGPLVLTGGGRNPITNQNLVIGVLSGGSRFFGPQPFGTLGTTSFYQPLSLYWQYIVANNPYRYVTANAGDGNWEDASRWQTTLDPNYRVIDSTGRIVSGLPTTPELGLNGTGGDWGAVCVEFEAPGDFCTDVRTGVTTDTSPQPAATEGVGNMAGFAIVPDVGVQTSGPGALSGEDASMPGTATFDLAVNTANGLGMAEDMAISGTALMGEDAPQNTGATLPAPTLANGLVGATGFVPNNVNPVVSSNPALRVAARYFDVTLANTGTTTLSSNVTIDKLTMSGNAGLTIASAGSLRSLVDVNQFGGRMNVNGGLTSIGDYTLFSGMLEGTGTVTAPFVTSIAGTISPGTMG
ncbi:MAG: autotransporter domain-containing protein, partial [Porphyrobacter sp.]|nr:autotransporter domain-containing protein [Porphyrobacter sp.]